MMSIIMLPTATFALTATTDGHTVTEVTGPTTAQRLLGRVFSRGKDPWSHDSGYACRIQKAINDEGGDHANPTDSPISEPHQA